MDKDILNIIRSNPYIYRLLREESFHYEYLLQDKNYIKTLEKISKKYKPTIESKLNKISNTIELVNSLIEVLN